MRPVEIGSSAEHGSSIRITVGIGRQRARDAQALLLAAGHPVGVALEPVLDLVPQRGALERRLDDLVHVALHAEHARAEGDVVVDRLRERVRLLEHHPDQLAHLDGVDVVAVEVLAVEEDLAADASRRARGRSCGSGSGCSVLLPQPDGPISAVMRCS